MIFDNSVQLDSINTFILDLWVSTIWDYEFIITDTDITWAYIYARACDNLDVITYVEKHPFSLQINLKTSI